MGKQIFIQQKQGLVEFAVLDNGLLVEFHSKKVANDLQEGDIYIGKVTKFLSGMNSFFVDIGESKQGFLHYSDLSPTILSFLYFFNGLIHNKSSKISFHLENFKLKTLTTKDGKINTILKNKDFLPVQVIKEPISTKGARLTTEISLPGRFVVLVPFHTKGISISKKILDVKERERLEKITEQFKHPLFTIIVRTAAQGIKEQEIVDDIKSLQAAWIALCECIRETGAKVQKVHSEDQRIISFLRDYLSNHYEQIVVNSRPLYDSIASYLKKIDKSKLSILKLSDHENVFDHYNVTKQIRTAFSAKVPLESGGHLVIQKTEAMHVIDVNSGFKVFSNDEETNAFENNLLAAKEICRQIKLRDLGGIIVIDFIDMKKPEHRKKIFDFISEFMHAYKERCKMLPISKFGIMQITRQRIRPEVEMNTSEKCPSCKGTGKVDAHVLIIEDEIEKNLKYLFSIGHRKLKIEVHPIIYAYIIKGTFKSILNKWRFKFKNWIKLEKKTSLHLTSYRIFDTESNEEIVLN